MVDGMAPLLEHLPLPSQPLPLPVRGSRPPAAE